MAVSIETLEPERPRLLGELAQLRDMRRGSLTEAYRRCGKSSCWCQQGDQLGYVPFSAFPTKVNGKTQTLQLRPGPLLSRLEREVSAYRDFRQRCEQLVRLNEKIC